MVGITWYDGRDHMVWWLGSYFANVWGESMVFVHMMVWITGYDGMMVWVIGFDGLDHRYDGLGHPPGSSAAPRWGLLAITRQYAPYVLLISLLLVLLLRIILP